MEESHSYRDNDRSDKCKIVIKYNDNISDIEQYESKRNMNSNMKVI